MRRLQADFNGLFGALLCLSHDNVGIDEAGNPVPLDEGMQVEAFEPDADEAGNPDELRARGVVERSPDWLACVGSRWVLRIDERGVHHASDSQ